MDKTAKEKAYTENRSMRDEALNTANYDMLDKIKAVQYLTDGMILSIHQVAAYYEVSNKSIETIITRNRDEFESDGMVVLTGEKLKQFKASFDSPSIEGIYLRREPHKYRLFKTMPLKFIPTLYQPENLSHKTTKDTSAKKSGVSFLFRLF